MKNRAGIACDTMRWAQDEGRNSGSKNSQYHEQDDIILGEIHILQSIVLIVNPIYTYNVV